MTGNTFPKRGRASPIPEAVPVTKFRGFLLTQTNAFSTLPRFACSFSFCGKVMRDGCIREFQGRRASRFHLSQFRSFPAGAFLHRTCRGDAVGGGWLASL